MSRHLGFWSAALAVAVAAFVVGLAAQTGAGIETLQIRSNVYLVGGGGSNVTVQIGDDGAIVVDAGSAASAPAVVAAIKKVTAAPIRYVINTGPDADHVGGNEIVAKAGQTLLSTRSTALPDGFFGTGASILSTEKVLARMSAPSGQASPFPSASWPTETFNNGRRYMYLNGEGIEVLQQAAAHTDGDAIVFFRRSDVVVAGDVIDADHFPVIDVRRGGSLAGELAALNRLIDLAIPSVPIVSREAGTVVVPGHGRLYDQFDVVHYRDMITIIRDHVADLMKSGRTLEQIKAAAPAKGYSGRYGSDSGPWTTDDFIEAMYRSLSVKKS